MRPNTAAFGARMKPMRRFVFLFFLLPLAAVLVTLSVANRGTIDLALMGTMHDAAIAAIDTYDEAALDEPAPENMRSFFPTVGSMQNALQKLRAAFGIDQTEHIQTCIDAIRAEADRLGL